MIPYLLPLIALTLCVGLTYYFTKRCCSAELNDLKAGRANEIRALYQCTTKAYELKFDKWCKEYDAAHKAEMRALNKSRINSIMARINGTHTDLRDNDVSELCRLDMSLEDQSGDLYDEQV